VNSGRFHEPQNSEQKPQVLEILGIFALGEVHLSCELWFRRPGGLQRVVTFL